MTVKVLIVDDEFTERRALKRILTEGIEEVEVVGEANNGDLAIELATSLKPDIVFMDIRMSGMDGLTAIKEIQRHLPQVEFIVVSAYDLFDYARRALRLGVKDFILKPSKIETILQTTEAVIEKIKLDSEEDSLLKKQEDRLEILLPLAEGDLVNQLLYDSINEFHREKTLEQFTGFKERVFVITLLVIGKDKTMYEAKKHDIYKDVREAFHQIGEGLVGSLSGGQIPIIVFPPRDVNYFDYARKIKRNLFQALEEFELMFTFFIGIGREYSSLKQVSKSYNESIMSTKDVNSERSYSFFRKSIHKPSSKIDLETSIFDELLKGRVEEIQYTIPTYIEHLKGFGISIQETKVRVSSLLLLLSHVLSNSGIREEGDYISLKAKTYPKLQREIRFLLQQMISSHTKVMIDSSSLSKQIIQYIEDHAHENITLERIASHVDLSPYYVSRILKKHTGTNYVDYLTSFRMNRAKELLVRTNKTVKEIAYMIGYNEPNYFSTVFKRTFGLSPTKYRAKIKKER